MLQQRRSSSSYPDPMAASVGYVHPDVLAARSADPRAPPSGADYGYRPAAPLSGAALMHQRMEAEKQRMEREREELRVSGKKRTSGLRTA